MQPMKSFRYGIRLMIAAVLPVCAWMINPWLAVGLPIILFAYAYLIYPAMTALAAHRQGRTMPEASVSDDLLPSVSISLPVYNESRVISSTIEALLAFDYPPEKLQIVVISDASTDGTDDIVREYGDSRVLLLRQPRRAGKTAAEVAGAQLVTGDIIVNTDATTRFPPNALRELVKVFADPSIGLASGRDVTSSEANSANQGEAHYTGFEMRLRDWETAIDSIVGASGCFFAIRRSLHDRRTPLEISRDFESAIFTRMQGYRAVSVPSAVCFVRLASSLRVEFRRKVRTMARGLDTLWHCRTALRPSLTSWRFVWMLASHKLCRWLVFLYVPFSIGTLALLLVSGRNVGVAATLMFGTAFLAVLSWLAFRWPEKQPMPRVLSLAGFAGLTFIAGALAWHEALAAHRNPIWEPTPRKL